MSQPNLFMIPIDESILLPMESLDQHLADSSKPSIISPILRNLLLQYGEPAFEILNYSETLPQEPMEFPQEDSKEQIALSEVNIRLSSENIGLPLGVPPNNYEMQDNTLKEERQEIAFIKRSIHKKCMMEKMETIENGIDKVYEEVKIKPSKRSKISIDQIAEKIAMSQSEIKEPIPSTSTVVTHETKTNQDTEHSSTSKKKGRSKKHLKRKEITEDHDKEPKKKKTKKDSLDNDKEPKKIKSKKYPVDKESEKIKGPEKPKERKTSPTEKKKSSKKQKSKKDLQEKHTSSVKESTECLVDVKKEMSSTITKKSIKRQSSNNLLKSEEESNVSNSSPAKRPRKSKLDITDPIYLEPFKYGWIREVVYRSTKDEATKIKKADTYYHSPEGKKFRTRKEMSEILSRHEHLTEDNFTYHPKPIGINDPIKEIIRDSFTSAIKKKVPSKKTTKFRKSSSQLKDSSQKDINISANNSEQNSDIVVAESNSQLEEESILDETNTHEATIENVAEPILAVSQYTISVESDKKVERSNLTIRLKESAELDNDEYVENKEIPNQRISPNVVQLNSIILSQFNNQNDNENKNVSDGECNLEIVNPSIITSNINRTTENSEIKPLKSIDLVNHLDKEIKSSSFNNVIKEVDLNKRKLNEYSDDSSESDYKLELEPVPEKNLEELNSSFSEKMFISETSMKNSETAEIKDYEGKNSYQKIETDNLTTEDKSQSNFDCIRRIDTKVEISKNLNSNKVSVPENLSTSPDVMKVSAISEKTNSLKETKTQNWIIRKPPQNNFGCIRSIDNKLEISNDSKVDNVSLLENSTTSSNTATGATGEKTKILKEVDNENLIIEKTSQSDLGCTESINSKVEISNVVPESSLTSLDPIKMSAVVVGEKPNSLPKIDTYYLTTDGTLTNLEHTRSIESTMEVSNDLKSDEILVPESLLMSLSEATKISATDEKINSLQIINTKNSTTEKGLQSNFDYLRSIDNKLEISNGLKSDNVSVLENSTNSSDIVTGATGEKTKSLKEVDNENLIIEKTSQSIVGCTENIDSIVEISNDLKSNEILVPERLLILSEVTKVSATDKKINSLQIINTKNSTTEKRSQSNLDCLRSVDNELEIPHDFKSDELAVTGSSSTSSISSKVSVIHEKPNSYKQSDADNLTANNNLQSYIDQTRNIDSAMEITTFISRTTLSTTLSVSSTESLTASTDSAMSTTQTSNTEDLSPTCSSSAMLSQSSSGAELASSSTDMIPKIATSLGSLISTTATVTEGKTISSSETLSIPLDKEVALSEALTLETENIEKLIEIADIKDNFDDVKSLVRGIKKVDQALYNSSESLYTDSAEHTYLVNTEGNTFSFTTASFKQSKQLVPNKDSVSQFKDDINCMKTIAESIKTLSLPSDLTNKQYFLSCPDELMNETMKNKSPNEIKFDNINLNKVNQISSQEEYFDKKPHVSCSKDNISKTDTNDCIQKLKSPSIVIAHSKNVWLELDNSILNKNKNLIFAKNESSDLKKMNIDLNASELSNLSEISGSTGSNTLTVTSREDTVRSTASKSEYQSAENSSPEFVRSQSYEYQNFSRDEVNENSENLNEPKKPKGNLDDTVSTLSGDSSLDNSNEHSNLYESKSMSKYKDYLVSNELSGIIDELAEKNHITPDKVDVTMSVELHNDLCEFIKLPPKKNFQNRRLDLSEQKEKSNVVMSNLVPVATKEISIQNNYNNATNDLTQDKNLQKQTYAHQTVEEINLCKCATLPPQNLLENRESNSYKFSDKNIDSVLTNVPTSVLKISIENNYNHAINNVPDQNLQKLACVNQAVAENQYSFECSADILVELNKLLEMNNENENDINQSVNVLHSNKLKQEDSKLKDISNCLLRPDCSRNISLMKPLDQSTPLSSLKHENKRINVQSRLACSHSMASFIAGYSALKHIFEYLNFEDLLIAMDVCTVWKEIAQQLHLWKKIRIRNSQLTYSLAKILQNYGTEHLLVVEEDSSDWRNFINVLPEIKSLRVIELCPCPALVFEEIVKNCPQLKIVNALSLKDESINVESIQNLSDPEKLHLGGVSSMSMEGDLSFLSGFSKLTHLSLRSIKDLGKKNVNVLQSLQELQSLELGECSEFMNTFGSTTLVELKNLKRLRLEKVQGSDCCTDILASVSKIEKLTELELVNVEVSKSFLKCLPKCQNLKKLLIIPMYKNRTAFSNNIIIKSSSKLRNLVRFVWGIPEEFVKRSKSLCNRPFDDCISVLKPIPFQRVLDDIESDYTDSKTTTSGMDTLILKMLPLYILKRLYAHVLPNTQTDILKIPTSASWNLSIT